MTILSVKKSLKKSRGVCVSLGSNATYEPGSLEGLNVSGVTVAASASFNVLAL